MRIDRIFSPLKIILDTPQEVEILESLLRKYVSKNEEKIFGWTDWNRKPPARETEEYKFLVSLLRACEQTSTQLEFKK